MNDGLNIEFDASVNSMLSGLMSQPTIQHISNAEKFSEINTLNLEKLADKNNLPFVFPSQNLSQSSLANQFQFPVFIYQLF